MNKKRFSRRYVLALGCFVAVIVLAFASIFLADRLLNRRIPATSDAAQGEVSDHMNGNNADLLVKDARLTTESFSRIKIGMTLRQVSSIVGEPNGSVTFGPDQKVLLYTQQYLDDRNGDFAGTALIWYDENDIVIRKKIDHPLHD